MIYGYDAMQYPVLDNQMTGRNQLIPTPVRPGENGLPQYHGDPLEGCDDFLYGERHQHWELGGVVRHQCAGNRQVCDCT